MLVLVGHLVFRDKGLTGPLQNALKIHLSARIFHRPFRDLTRRADAIGGPDLSQFRN